MTVSNRNNKYLDILLEPIKLCSEYTPKFGTSNKSGTTLIEFKNLYASDPLYHWIGFDSDLMYAAHKAAGGITSLYTVCDLKRDSDRESINEWLKLSAIKLGIDENRSQNLAGAVFEIRQGYKSADSKRQNADLLNAIRAYNENFLPVMMVLSAQINSVVLKRYQTAQLLVLVGILHDDPTISTYAFCERVLNYSLVDFFRNNSDFIKSEINNTLESLLKP